MRREHLSLEQEHALQLYEDGNNLFVTGPAGTGKTCLIKQMVSNAIARKKHIQVCAMTGCAAILLGCHASTLHSWSGIRLAKGTPEEICNYIQVNKKATTKWVKTDILVIDEISMMSKRIFDILNYIGKRIRKSSAPFGGLQLIFTGDFYQLPPVNGPEEGSGMFCFESEQWYETFIPDNHIVLSTIYRQNDPIYKNILNHIRIGQITPDMTNLLNTYIGREFNKEEHNGCVPTKLYAIHKKVEYINKQMFDSIDSPSYEYTSIMKKDCCTWIETGKILGYDVLSKCKKELTHKKTETELEYMLTNCPCERTLNLKIGANVMCTVNLDVDAGICNGSIGIVIDFEMISNTTPVPLVRFSNGVKRLMMLKYWQSEEFPTLAIAQIPLRLAWAMTIHKIQGATLPMAEIDIGHSIFEYGQTYVALSRVQNLQGLYLCGFQPGKIKVHPKVQAFYGKIPLIEYEEEIESDNSQDIPESDLKLELEPESDLKLELEPELGLESELEPSSIQTQKCDKHPPLNAGKPWSSDEETQLLTFLQEDMTIKYISQKLQRTNGSITARRKHIAYQMHLRDSSISDIIHATKLTEKQIQDAIYKYNESKNTKNIQVSFEQFAYVDEPDKQSTIDTDVKIIKC